MTGRRESARAEGILARLDALTVWPYPRRVLIVVGAAYFFAFFDIVTIGIALPVISEQFHVSAGRASLAVTLSLVGYVAGSLLDSLLSDYIGRGPALVASVLMFSVGCAVTAVAPGLPLLFAGRFITGMGIGAEIEAASAFVGELSPARLRGRAGSVTVAWGYVGLAVVPVLGLVLVPDLSWGWRLLFVIGGLGGLVVLPFRLRLPVSPRWLTAHDRDDEADTAVTAAEDFAALRLERRPAAAGVAPGAAPAGSGAGAGPGARPQAAAPLLEPAQPEEFWRSAALFVAVWFVYYIGNYGWLTLAPTLLTEHGFGLTNSLAFLSVTGVGFVAGSLIAVAVGERVERKWTIAAALVAWAVVLTGIGLWPVAAVIMSLGFLASLTIGLAVPLMYVFTGEQFHSTVRARGIALGDGVGHIGGALAPVLILPAAAVAFGWGFAVMALSGLIAAGLVLLGRRMTGRAVE